MQKHLLSKKNYYSIILFILTLFFFSSCSEDVSSNSRNGLVVIIKADDLEETTPNWNRFMKMASDNGISAGVGVISGLVKKEGTIAEIQRISAILQSNKFPAIEFWNHGYDHSMAGHVSEFKGTDTGFQKEHFQLNQKFFSDTLHFTSHSFGDLYSRSTLKTVTAISYSP